MIVLAIESSNSRGMGHLFRSFLITRYMEQHNINYIYLINKDVASINVLEEHGIAYHLVDYCDETDWEKSIIIRYGISIWINDKFETSLNMAKHIKEAGSRLALIDDIGPGERYADVNYVGLVYFTKQHFLLKNTKIGMEYVILNDEINRYKRYRSRLNRVIVSFGGSDPNGNTVKVVKLLSKTNISFDVVVGPNNRDYRKLEKLQENRFTLYHNVPSLVQLFFEYDLAITGGGVTCCEANAAGLPCVIIANAPHEVNTGIYLEKYGGCIFAGDYENLDMSILSRIDKLDLRKMSENGMKIFDTHAVERIFSDLMLSEVT